MRMSQLNLKVEHRRNLYYNKFLYRASIDLPNIQNLRYFSSYDEYINYRGYYRFDKSRDLPNKDEIELYFEYRDNHAGDAKIRMEYGKVIIYSNDVAKLHSAVARIKPAGKVTMYSVVFPAEPETLEFAKEPKYKFRNYFRAKNVSAETKAMMLKFINDQTSTGAEIAFNDAMIQILKRKSFRADGVDYLHAHYFVDYNDESLQVLLALMFGEYLNPKIFRLVKRPK